MNPLSLMMGGNPLSGALGGDKKDDAGTSEAKEEDPEVIQARIEQEERRKDKHRQLEREREKMRDGIRNKYNIKKKDEEELALEAALSGQSFERSEEKADDGLLGQMGLGDAATKAKDGLTSVTDTIKGFLPFGK